MKKIIHLSDLHIGHNDCGERFRQIVAAIRTKEQPASDYIVVITGDIVENANLPEQTEEAIESIARLEKSGFRILVIPGNHDYGTGAWGDRKFVKLFKENYYRNPAISYPKLDIIDDMAFIGLDSTAGELNWYDRIFSEGELGREQIRRLVKIIGSEVLHNKKRIIYMHHHPFDFKMGMQLKDRNKLEKAIAGRVDMILFGHYHSDAATSGRNFNGSWGIPRCYNAGSATHKNGNIGFHRVIDLSYSDPVQDYNGRYL
jgi:3',5'-cyclic AMP phosphodiesterase CpdA